MFRYIILAGVAAISGCANTPMTASSTDTITREYTIVRGPTRSGDTQLAVAAKASNDAGRVKLCAAATARGSLTFEDRWAPALLGASSFYFEDELVARRADFGARYAGDERLVGKSANCATLDEPWKPTYDERKVDVRIGSITLYD